MDRNQRAEDEQHAANRVTSSLAGLAASLLLIVIALVVVRELQVRCMLEVRGSRRPPLRLLAVPLMVSLANPALGGSRSARPPPSRAGTFVLFSPH
jgi:hypothetical protein